MHTTNQFSDLDQSHWSTAERENAALVHKFIQLLMNEHDFPTVLQEFGASPYAQHNRTMEDGVQGVVDSVTGLVKRYPDFSYDIKDIVPNGDRVVVFSHATTRASHRGDERKGFIIFDMWRIADGRLVEHWDAIQGLDGASRLFLASTGGRIRNANGPF